MKQRQITNKLSRLMLALSLTVWAGGWSCAPLAIAATETSAAANAANSIFKEVEQLVKEQYPKAKFTQSGNVAHFEYKLKNQLGYYSGRTTLAPQSGGILGDISLEAGQYQGSDKDNLPSEQNDGFDTTLLMAPYSQGQNAHLLTTLTFPADVPIEFKHKFKEIIAKFGAGKETAAAAPAASSAPVPPAATAASPTASGTVGATNTGGETLAAGTTPTGLPQPSSVSTPPAEGLPAEATKRKLMLFKVTRGNQIIYLLGTVGIGRKDFYPLNQEIEDKFAASKDLIEEFGPPDTFVVAKPVVVSNLLKPGDTFSNHVSPEVLQGFTEFLDWSHDKMSEYARYKPWHALWMIYRREEDFEGGRSGLSISSHFELEESGRKTMELNPPESKASLRAETPSDRQNNAFLNYLIDTRKTTIGRDRLIELWRAADLDQLDTALAYVLTSNQTLMPKLKKAIADKNNWLVDNLVKKIQDDGPHFVAIDAFYFGGKQGMLALLQEKGYKIEQLYSTHGDTIDPAKTSAADEIDYSPYIGYVEHRIKQAWTIPKGCEKDHPVAAFKIHSTGAISDLKLTQKTIHPAANQAALTAIQHAAPFHRLPTGSLENVDIEITFSEALK